MRPAIASPTLPLISAFQATTSRDAENLRLSGFVITAVLIGALMIINVYTRRSAKNFEEYEDFMQMLKRVMLEGRREVARLHFVAGDRGAELGLSCMEDSDDLKDICGPQCRYGLKADPDGPRKQCGWKYGE